MELFFNIKRHFNMQFLCQFAVYSNRIRLCLFKVSLDCVTHTSDHIIRRAPLPVSSAKLSRIELG